MDWRPCAKEVRSFLLVAAKDGLLPNVVEQIAPNFDPVDLELDPDKDRSTDRLEMIEFMRVLTYDVWTALLESGEPIDRKWELLAIALPDSPHACHDSGTCVVRLRMLGTAAAELND